MVIIACINRLHLPLLQTATGIREKRIAIAGDWKTKDSQNISKSYSLVKRFLAYNKVFPIELQANAIVVPKEYTTVFQTKTASTHVGMI